MNKIWRTETRRWWQRYHEPPNITYYEPEIEVRYLLFGFCIWRTHNLLMYDQWVKDNPAPK